MQGGCVADGSLCMSDGECFSQALQAEKRQHAKVIKSSSAQKTPHKT